MQSDGPRVPVGADAIPPPATVHDAEVETAEQHVHMPELSVWPIAAAAGLTVAAAGLVTSPLLGFAGLIVLIISIASWIQELRHERRQHH